MPIRSCLPFISILFLFSCQTQPDRYDPALSPEESLQRIQLEPGFDIQLFAHEPILADPVEMVFDEYGRAWVVEMPEYPYKPEPGEEKSRIRLLEDTDGDGKMDHSVIFADKIREATSILPWEGGLLVASAPHIYFMKDTNEDFKADIKEVLFKGFFDNNSEAQITNLRYSIDNWIYAANFGQPGEVSSTRNPSAETLSVTGTDFRFRLDRDQFENATGPTQFGQALDAYGNRFVTMNTLHIRHAVIPHRYVRRHSYLPSFSQVVNIYAHDPGMYQATPPPYWRAERTARRQKRYDEEGLDRKEYAEDHFTGCSGGTIYEGDAFPEAYRGNFFVGDVAGNLVHRDILTPHLDMPTYVARRDPKEGEREFLMSTDSWFRPANFTIGPDGSLYVVDMYRQHIETPLSIPEDLKAEMDFYAGEDQGRIYRILPDDFPEADVQIYPGEMTAEGLTSLLEHPHRWWRLTAQRLLIERQATEVIPTLVDILHESPSPKARLHALYTLEGLDAVDYGIVFDALHDTDPHVQIHALRLSESYPQSIPEILTLVDTEDPRVALQLALTLGEFGSSLAQQHLLDVAIEWGNNEWTRIAVLSSPTAMKSAFFSKLLSAELSTEAAQGYWKKYGYMLAVRNQPQELATFLTLLQKSGHKQAGLAGIQQAIDKKKVELELGPEMRKVWEEMKGEIGAV